ncbi:bcl-2-related ovarian killer protein homolog A isoform X2 [Xiphophorus hellerii]|uniref:bcl-2-related ovarian killer protein homolog A isoform X2 n=1 Tax=Xiphophorus hellerii TaxID=8084 RepID=UPI0013B359E3|nr:bcl-2-related ovarian killer protein isoform X2 [Xiphophorus hellerii]
MTLKKKSQIDQSHLNAQTLNYFKPVLCEQTRLEELLLCHISRNPRGWRFAPKLRRKKTLIETQQEELRGDELEYLRPNVYRNVARQLNITVAVEGVVSDAFMAVAADIFSTGVTWGKVVSLYAVAGALAVDCVRHGHPAMVHTIVDCMGEFVRKSLTPWLKKRGGWADITKCVVNTGPTLYSHWLVSAAFAFGHYLKAVVLYLLREK